MILPQIDTVEKKKLPWNNFRGNQSPVRASVKTTAVVVRSTVQGVHRKRESERPRDNYVGSTVMCELITEPTKDPIRVACSIRRTPNAITAFGGFLRQRTKGLIF